MIMIVVMAIISILALMLFPIYAAVHEQKRIVLAQKNVAEIQGAAKEYYSVLNTYPPDCPTPNGSYSKGQDMAPISFGGEAANHYGEVQEDPYAIFRFLGTDIQDENTNIVYDKLLNLDHRFIKDEPAFSSGSAGGNAQTERIYVDPWGEPYALDAFHTRLTTDGTVETMGWPIEGYGQGVLGQEEIENEVKVYSKGPDRRQDPAQIPTHPEDPSNFTRENIDNVISW